MEPLSLTQIGPLDVEPLTCIMNILAVSGFEAEGKQKMFFLLQQWISQHMLMALRIEAYESTFSYIARVNSYLTQYILFYNVCSRYH